MIRRSPIRGMNPFDPIHYQIVNIADLNEFAAGTVVTAELLAEHGIVRKAGDKVKILGDGELSVKLTVKAHKFSKAAAEKIKAKGGTAEAI